MTILACHQPNFCPWLSFFDKMNKADIFVILTHCQFEKNGWQNRCMVNKKYWTKPVRSGREPIHSKHYVDGQKVAELNIDWIIVMAKTLGIDVEKIRYDYPTHLSGTLRLIDICEKNKCESYLTNPEAVVKYFDMELAREYNLNIVDHKFPHKLHTFEAFDRWGVTGTVNLLRKEKELWKASLSSSQG